MPIRPFLAGQAFEPELIAQMSAAFVRACEALRLEMVDDPSSELAIGIEAITARRNQVVGHPLIRSDIVKFLEWDRQRVIVFDPLPRDLGKFRIDFDQSTFSI